MVTNLLLFNCLNLRYGGTTVNFKLLKKNETLLGKRVILFMKNDSLSSPGQARVPSPKVPKSKATTP